jgi:two-component system sensor histidine kinase TctE
MPSREKLRQRRNRADEKAAGEHNSLFGEILDWMLAPLMFVWPISIAIIHNVADDIADAPYDKVLGDSVFELSRQVRSTPVGAALVKPPQIRDLFHIDGEDVIYYQVLDGAGRLLAGDSEVPDAPLDKTVEGRRSVLSAPAACTTRTCASPTCSSRSPPSPTPM